MKGSRFSWPFSSCWLRGRASRRAPAPRAYDTFPDWSGAWSMVGGTVFDRATQTARAARRRRVCGRTRPTTPSGRRSADRISSAATRISFPTRSRTAACRPDSRVTSTFPIPTSSSPPRADLGAHRERPERDAHLHRRAEAPRGSVGDLHRRFGRSMGRRHARLRPWR